MWHLLGFLYPLLFILTYIFRLSELGSFGPKCTHLPGCFCPGACLGISDRACYHPTALCHVYFLYQDILQGSSQLCNWLSLRYMMPWVNHLPLYVGSLWGNIVWNDCGFVSLTEEYRKSVHTIVSWPNPNGKELFLLFSLCLYICIDICLNVSQ